MLLPSLAHSNKCNSSFNGQVCCTLITMITRSESNIWSNFVVENISPARNNKEHTVINDTPFNNPLKYEIEKRLSPSFDVLVLFTRRSLLTQICLWKKHVKKICPTACIYKRISSSTDFSLKMPSKLFLPPISDGFITTTVSSWVYPVLSTNLSRRFKTLLQDSFSRHLVITTLHLS